MLLEEYIVPIDKERLEEMLEAEKEILERIYDSGSVDAIFKDGRDFNQYMTENFDMKVKKVELEEKDDCSVITVYYVGNYTSTIIEPDPEKAKNLKKKYEKMIKSFSD